MSSPIVIDGSMGEGGGQIVRTAVALAAALGKPIKVINIRAKRPRPGLAHQHLAAVRAVAEVSGGRLVGAALGSTMIEFYPGRPRPGSYTFDIGTAGSITLLLQALMPVMTVAPGAVLVRVRGGTDVPKAPPVDYLRFVLAPLLRRFGLDVKVSLIRRGHYPRGGGEVEVVVSRSGPLRPVELRRSGRVLRVRGLSHCVRLPAHVAIRQAASASEALERALGVRPEIRVEHYEGRPDPHLGPGSGITVWAETEASVLGGDSLGERGKPAERVGAEAAQSLIEDLSTGMALDRHASDMLVVYALLASGTSVLGGSRLSSHARTMIELANMLAPGSVVDVRGSEGGPFEVTIKGLGVA